MQYYNGYQINTQCGGVELRKSGCSESMFFQAGDDASAFMDNWHSYAATYGADRACAELWALYSDAFAFEGAVA